MTDVSTTVAPVLPPDGSIPDFLKRTPGEKPAAPVAPPTGFLDGLSPRSVPELKSPPKKDKKLRATSKPLIVKPPRVRVKKEAAPAPVKDPNRVIKGSIIKPQYKAKYKKNGDYSCGDDLALEIKAYIAPKGKVDLKLLREIAEVNAVWKDNYAQLNAGQQRMTIGNRLRAKHRNGDRLDIGGAIMQLEMPE